MHEDDALRAVRAAADMREALDAPQQGARARPRRRRSQVGSASTPARSWPATVGEQTARDRRRRERRRRGSSRPPRPGEVLIGEPTYRLVRDAVEAEPVEPLELKGKAERVAGVPPRRRSPARRRPSRGAWTRRWSGASGSSRSCCQPFEARPPTRVPALHGPRLGGRREVAAGRGVPRAARGSCRRCSAAGACPTATASRTSRWSRS